MNRNSGSFPCNGHLGVKVKDENGGIHFSGNGSGGYEMGLNNSMVGDSTKYYCGMPDVPCTNTRSFTDLISFNSLLSKPSSVDVHASKPVLRSLHLSDSKKQGNQSPNSHVSKLALSNPTSYNSLLHITRKVKWKFQILFLKCTRNNNTHTHSIIIHYFKYLY